MCVFLGEVCCSYLLDERQLLQWPSCLSTTECKQRRVFISLIEWLPPTLHLQCSVTLPQLPLPRPRHPRPRPSLAPLLASRPSAELVRSQLLR